MTPSGGEFRDIEAYPGTLVQVSLRPAQVPHFAPLFASLVRKSVTGTDRWPIQFGSAPRESLDLRPPVDDTAFAADKTWYAGQRDTLARELSDDGLVRVDFGKARYATQSALHALLYQPLRRVGPSALERIWFENAQPQVRAVLVQVIDYALAHHEAQRGAARTPP